MMIVLWTIGLLGVTSLLGFVGSKKNSMICTGISIDISGDSSLHFFSQKELTDLIEDRNIRTYKQKISSVNLMDVEKIIREHPAIDSAEAYFTIDGVLKIRVVKREPLLRIIDLSGDSYYIDKKGKYMPVLSNFTAYVPVITGFISDPWHKYSKSVLDLNLNTQQEEKAISDDLFAICSAMASDTFLSALPVQYYVNKDKDIEIIPRIGPDRILIGDKTNLTAKLESLKLFYTKAFHVAGGNKYSSINIKYHNQIIGTKKIE